MANPTTYAPITQAIREVTEQGLGNVRVVAANSFSSQFAYEGRTEAQQAVDGLWKPQILVRIGPKVPVGSNTVPSFSLQNVTFNVDLTYKLDSPLIRSKRQETLDTIHSDAFAIVGALTKGGNLTQTAAGDATGLSSGRLEYVNTTEPRMNWNTNGVGTISVIFTGTVALDYP